MIKKKTLQRVGIEARWCGVLSHFNHVWLCATLWTIACQASLSMGFSRQYWAGLSCPPLGGLPNPGIEPGTPALQAFFTIEPSGKPIEGIYFNIKMSYMTNSQQTYSQWWKIENISSIFQCNCYQATNGIFHKTTTNNFTICRKHKRSWIAKAILRKKNGAGSINLPDFRLYQKVSHQNSPVLEQNRNIDQWNKVQNPGQIHAPMGTFGEGNGNPLQYSCLENPMDGKAW